MVHKNWVAQQVFSMEATFRDLAEFLAQDTKREDWLELRQWLMEMKAQIHIRGMAIAYPPALPPADQSEDIPF